MTESIQTRGIGAADRPVSPVRRARMGRGMSVRQAAEAVGMPYNSYLQWELWGVPESVERAVALAGVLDVEVADLCRGGPP